MSDQIEKRSSPRVQTRPSDRVAAVAVTLMTLALYGSDLNDDEWALLAPLINRSHPVGRRQFHPLRRILDAAFYLLCTGAQW